MAKQILCSGSVDSAVFRKASKSLKQLAAHSHIARLSKKDRTDLELYQVAFERAIGGNVALKEAENRRLLTKCKACGISEEAFFKNPDVARYIVALQLHHSIPYWNDKIHVDSSTHEIKIMINGTLKNPRELLSQLCLVDGEICNKSNLSEKWYYLPGKGLTEWQQSEWKELKPITKLTEEELQYAQSKAEALTSPEKKGDEKFILEIASSWMDTPYNALTGGLAETMQMPRHPWLRMVTEEGDLYSVGFAWKTPTKPHNIANTVKGVFRMPDPYETMPIQARPVTRISIDKEQFDKIKKNIETYQKEGIAFNLLQHNCTRFIEYILNDIGIKPPLKTSISEVAERILPIGIKKFLPKLKNPYHLISRRACLYFL